MWSPDKWGPYFWTVMHITALYFDHLFMRDPTTALGAWTKFVHGITMALPCSQCKNHFLEFQSKDPVPSSSKGPNDPTCLKWTVRAHNAVRIRTHKFVPKVEDVVAAYRAGTVYRAPTDDASPRNMSLRSDPTQTNTEAGGRTVVSLDKCVHVEALVVKWQVAFGATLFVLVLCMCGLVICIRRNTHTRLSTNKQENLYLAKTK